MRKWTREQAFAWCHLQRTYRANRKFLELLEDYRETKRR
jgi:hypothetical protein